jgi:hypothetical protein
MSLIGKVVRYCTVNENGRWISTDIRSGDLDISTFTVTLRYMIPRKKYWIQQTAAGESEKSSIKLTSA